MSILSILDPCSPRPVEPFAARAVISPLLRTVGADDRVPLLPAGSARYVEFDHAASTPALVGVADHVARVLPTYASVHRGAGYRSQIATRLYESARERIAQFVGARPDDVTVITRNTTDALNLLASCVPGETVCLDGEHHAALLPFDARVVTACSTVTATLDVLESELRRRPAALLVVTGASNVTGERLPLSDLTALAHRHGARLAVDGAQLVPHRRVDVSTLGVDYLAFSGHKTYAPYGAGVLVGRRDWLDAAPPYLAGGGAVRSVQVSGAEASADWAPAPARHEGGSPNVLGAVALAEACRLLAALPEHAAEQHEQVLQQRLLDGLTALAGVRVLRQWSDSTDAVGIVTITVDGYAPGLVAAYLSAEHGIGVRDGRFCAHPLLNRIGLDGAVRLSLGVGSSSADVERVLDALRSLSRQGPSLRYVERVGHWVPAQDTRPLPDFCGPGTLGDTSTVASPCRSATA